MIKIIYPIEIFIGLFKELGENDADNSIMLFQIKFKNSKYNLEIFSKIDPKVDC